jgi:NADPH2:quinone reductase
LKAIWYERNGTAEEVLQFGDMPAPAPGPGDVRVKLVASGVNKADTKMREGAQGQTMPFPRIIPHQDGAGVIDAVGAGVTQARIGQRVWLFEAQINRPSGTAAEYVVVPESNAAPLPPNSTFQEGACLGIPAMTAHRCLFQDGPIAGKTILITGGSGGVGFYAVQLAKLGGARVIATASKADTGIVSDAGADYVLERATDLAKRIKDIVGEPGVDRIVDVAFGENLNVTPEILSVDGIISTYASDSVREPRFPFYPLSRKNPTLHLVFVFAMSQEAHRQAAVHINEAMAMGALKHRIGLTLQLKHTRRAHLETEKGTHGRVIVEVGG